MAEVEAMISLYGGLKANLTWKINATERVIAVAQSRGPGNTILMQLKVELDVLDKPYYAVENSLRKIQTNL